MRRFAAAAPPEFGDPEQSDVQARVTRGSSIYDGPRSM